MNGRTMNYNRYYQAMESMREPIMPSQLPKFKMDINGMVAYARSQGKKVVELSEIERKKFIEL